MASFWAALILSFLFTALIACNEIENETRKKMREDETFIKERNR